MKIILFRERSPAYQRRSAKAWLVAMGILAGLQGLAAPLDLSNLRWYCQQAILMNEAPYSNVQSGRGLAASVDGQYLYLGHNNSPAPALPAVIQVRNDRTATTTNQFASNVLVRLYGYRGKAIAADDRGRVYLAEGSGPVGSPGVWWPVGGAPVTNAALPVAGINIFDSTLSNRLYTLARTSCEGVALKREGGTLALYATDRNRKTLTRWELGENGGAITSAVQTGLAGAGEITNAAAGNLRGVDVDANGRIWMADVDGGKVWRCDHDGSHMTNVVVPTPFDVSCADGRVYVSSQQSGTDNAGSIYVLDDSTMAAITNLVRPPAGVTGVTNGYFSCLDVLPGVTGLYVHVEDTGSATPALAADSRWQVPVIHVEPTASSRQAPVILSGASDSVTNFILRWSSATGEFYAVETGTNLVLGFPTNAAVHITATPGVNTSTVRVDAIGPRFFRVRVEP